MMSHTRVNHDVKMLFTACEISSPRYHELREKQRYLNVKQKWHGLQVSANISAFVTPSSADVITDEPRAPLVTTHVETDHLSTTNTNSAHASIGKE